MDNKLKQKSSMAEYFKLDYLSQITDGFSENKIIGWGGYGKVYKGEHQGKPIAVKRFYNNVGLDDKIFDNEYNNIVVSLHPNIVRLVGYCHDTQQVYSEKVGKFDQCERLLCFEYLLGEALEKYISEKSCSFGWHTRCKIIKGICMGIKYLHDINIWHLDLKPANIFLDTDMTPKIGDFGLSRKVDSREIYTIEKTIGTKGYMPPEYIDDQEISNKYDVFSLGMVIIEIIAGTSGKTRGKEMFHEDFINNVLQNWGERMQDKTPSHIRTCIEIALQCVDDDRGKRPTITEIVNELNKIGIDSVQMDPPAADSFSYTAFTQQPAVCHGMTTLVDPLSGVPVYVMLPFNTVGADGQLSPTLTLKRNLEELKSVGVAGVVVEVWWGVVERKGPKKYDWSAYLQIVEMVKNAKLRLKMVLSFHQCKIDDSINIPLPPWVVKKMEANQDMMYTDAEGRRNPEYISLGCDTKPVLQRRTPLQVYEDYMHGLHGQFGEYLGKDSVIVEIQVGMGPDGQLMYPSYSKANGWHFPGIGEFQCYDKYMKKSLKKSLKKADKASEKPEWASVGGPTGTGTYNESPENTDFFKKDGKWKYEYGRFFLSWYSRKLLKHGDRLLAAAVYVFGESSDVTLSAKVPGIHWHYGTSSHAAELMAGYYNTQQKEVDNTPQKDVLDNTPQKDVLDNMQRRDRYLPIIKMLHKHGAMLNFSCVEMRDYEQPAQANSSPETLVKQVGEVAKKANVLLLGENALPRYDEYAFSQVTNTARRIGMNAFTYQRLSQEMFQPDNWRRFVEFVKDMSEISANAP